MKLLKWLHSKIAELQGKEPTPQQVEELRQNLLVNSRLYPECLICGKYDGYFMPEIEILVRSRAEFCACSHAKHTYDDAINTLEQHLVKYGKPYEGFEPHPDVFKI